MAKEICISSTPHETRLAILEDDQLSEIYYERENEYTLAGSIYNGKVTRVLPGMQSAFVDVGLDRDAFLYVADFMELDDSEETDELEKAAVSGANLPPREVHHSNVRAEESSEARSEGRSRRSGRPQREVRIEETSEPEIVETELISAPVVEAELAPDGTQEDAPSGGRRWRGRRRGRGRGRSAAPSEEPIAAEETTVEEPIEVFFEEESTTDIHASAPAEAEPEPVPQPRPQRSAPRSTHTPEPFVLPGESLSKYGGRAVDEESAPAPKEPALPRSTAKPSTLIEVPLEWDGSGLLPGESISKHRERLPEPVEQENDVDVDEETIADDEEELLQDEDDDFAASDEEILEEELLPRTPAKSSADEPTEGSASYRVDPASPSGFRLFGFGKKKEEKHDEDAPSVSRVSAYAPGPGHIEEELLEDEEFEVIPRTRRNQPGPVVTSNEVQGQSSRRRRPNDNDRNRRTQPQPPAAQNNDEDEESEGSTQQNSSRDRGRGRRGRGQQQSSGGNNHRGPSRRSMQTTDLPVISDLLKPGQEILVQIAKEPIAKKGARITSHIALPGRFLVFMPTVNHVGVSRKIASDEERHRLKKILTHERGESTGGFIVRTAAEGASEEELRADLRFLMNLWNDIKQRSDNSKSPALIYHDLSLIERILRDQVSSNFANIWVDSEADYERIVRFLNRFSPTLVRRVKLYTKETPMFEHFGIEDEISKALRSKVWLKSGGSIVINQTEALVAIDINTGKYVGKSARLEDTIVKTNLDAVPEIVRQIRLRDLGGIIIIDFIDMDERKNRFKVMAALEEALKNDRAPTKVLQFNDFGLVAITRKRVKQSLERTLSVPCPTCQATGMVKSPLTVANEIYVELRKMKKHFESADITLRVHPETVKVLKQNNARWLVEFEELTGKNVLVKSDPTLHPEQFDVQG